MDQQSLLKEIKELDSYLTYHSDLYYKELKPEIPDEVFDKKVVELRDLLSQWKGVPIPTILDKVGDDRTGYLEEVEHTRPMISIRTEVDTSEKPVEEFAARCEKLLPDTDILYVAEPKYDGLAISLRYDSNGYLERAVTRGDGETGEDITRNIIHIPNISRVLPPSVKYEEVRGELVLLKRNFTEANVIRIKNKEKPFVNCRNAIAGIIRKKVPDTELLALAYFIPYSCFGESTVDSQLENLVNLKQLYRGAGYLERSVGYKGYWGNLYEFYKEIECFRADLPFEIDGIVYKVNSLALQEKMGVSGREPRWSIAHKLPAEIARTTLKSIDVQVGPSGRLTPVARLDPVFVGGTTVSNVTLSNIFQIRRKGVRVGDTVELQRAGDVIPEIIGRDMTVPRVGYVDNFHMPTKCPVCHGVVQRTHGESNHYCIASYSCPAQASGLLARACSNKLLNIDGFGPAVAESMVNLGFTKISDIFDLTMSDMIDLEVGQANGQKLLNEIKRVAKTPIGFDMLLRLIGIAELGASASKKIAAVVGDLETFMDTNPDIYAQHGVNCRVIANIKDFHKDEQGPRDAFLLQTKLLVVNYEKNVDGCLAGMTIVVSGATAGISREMFKKRVEDLGGKIGSSVSKNTTYLVYGDGAGDKLEKAKKLNLKVLTYEQFNERYPDSRV